MILRRKLSAYTGDTVAYSPAHMWDTIQEKEEKHGDDVHDRNDSHGSFARSDPLLATEETIERLRSAFS